MLFNFKSNIDIIKPKKMWLKNKIIILTSILIFLYPLFGVIIKHWFSGIATLIIILGVLHIISTKNRFIKHRCTFDNRELFLNFLILMLFISYLLSGFVNGWNENQLNFFAGEFNFLLFSPIYIIVRDVKNSVELLIKGVILSGIFMFLLYLNQIIILENYRVTGPYGHLFVGPIAVLVMFVSISAYKYLSDNRTWKMLIITSTLMSFTTAIYSRSGTAYILMVALTIFSPFIIFKGYLKRTVFIVIFFTSMLIVFFTIPLVKDGVNVMVNGVSMYFYSDNKVNPNMKLGTVGTRIELWIIGIKVFRENIVFGVGRNNFKQYAEIFKEKGVISLNTFNYSAHPHNIYIETLVSKGLVGFAVLTLIIYFLFKNYINAKNNNIRFSDVAIIHLIFILIAGLGTEAPLIKNNFLSVFLLYTAVFYSYNIREMRILNTLKI